MSTILAQRTCEHCRLFSSDSSSKAPIFLLQTASIICWCPNKTENWINFVHFELLPFEFIFAMIIVNFFTVAVNE